MYMEDAEFMLQVEHVLRETFSTPLNEEEIEEFTSNMLDLREQSNNFTESFLGDEPSENNAKGN